MNEQRSNTAVSPTQAKVMILAGEAPADLTVHGDLDLSLSHDLTDLPDGLTVDSLDLSGCTALEALPQNLTVRRALILDYCTALTELPIGLHCYELSAVGTPLKTLPADISVDFKVDLTDCGQLERLPDGLKVGSLVLRNCYALLALPEGLDVYFLDISGCVSLTDWPLFAKVRVGHFRARGCIQLTHLPVWINQLTELDVSGCESLLRLPHQLQVLSRLDIGGTAVTHLPVGCLDAELFWNGVRINERIAFSPETITAEETMHEQNIELRRVLMERMGYERFMANVDAELIDRDFDPGGERKLLKAAVPGDEDFVCLAVICPSTGRQYLIRVPPTMTNCQQAAAWIAGFDIAEAYAPLVET